MSQIMTGANKSTEEVTTPVQVDKVEDVVNVKDNQEIPVIKNTEVEVKKPVVTQDPKEVLEQLKEKGTFNEKALLKTLYNYEEIMNIGKVVTPNDGALQQQNLYSVLKWILTDQSIASEFKKLWSIVLLFALVHQDSSFSDMSVFRFNTHWNKSKEDLIAFEAILSLILTTRNPVTRQTDIKRINFDKLTNVYFNGTIGNKLQSYYSV